MKQDEGMYTNQFQSITKFLHIFSLEIPLIRSAVDARERKNE